jgi:excisionase family DNA binding protein
MPPALARKYATIEAEAERLGVNPRTIRRRIADGTITGYRIGARAIRVDPAEVDEKLLRPIPTVDGAA